jgi:creatinine amidohydrolase
MRFSDLNWFDVEGYLEKEDRVMLVLGACEQHGYLSLLTDVNIPLALADAASQQTGVLVAPPVNYGVSPYFEAYPGTVSLRSETFLNLVGEVVRDLARQGFGRILVLNGHGGNHVARTGLYEVLNEVGDLRISWYEWWTSPGVQAVAQTHDLKPAHASWLEAFSFNIVAELPEGEKTPPYVPGLLSAEKLRELYGDGSFGGSYRASEEIMQEIFTAALEDVLQKLTFSRP